MDNAGRAGASGPLRGFRIIELAGIGPAPYAAMLLSDLGADVIRVERTDTAAKAGPAVPGDIVTRGRRSIAVDLKSAAGPELVLDLVSHADALLDPYRPGAAERLGVGPDACLARRPELVYGRMTGWGQDGPLARHAGHDINYVALAGALAHIGRAGQPPVPPLNLVGDMGGGGLFLAFGVVCGLLEARRTGRGQVVDAAMIDGVSSLMTMVWGYHAQGLYSLERGHNVIDSGAPFYDVYECSDGKYVSVGPIEHRFYARLIEVLGLRLDDLPPRRDQDQWPAARERLAALFRQRHPGRVVRPAGGRAGHLLRAGTRSGRGAAAPSPPGAGHVRTRRRDHPAGSGAPVQRHPRRDPAAAGAARRAHRRGARRVAVPGRRRAGRPPGPGHRCLVVPASDLRAAVPGDDRLISGRPSPGDYRARGSLRIRSAMMPSWISEVPPPIVSERENRNARCRADAG